MFGGKGGVGKTTCAAGYAAALAASGVETLVLSTDPAHSLGDAIETELSGEPTEVATDLYAVEIDPSLRADTYRMLGEALASDMNALGMRLDDESIDTLFGARMPGADEVAALDQFGLYMDEWQHVVFDTAPTGHTLRLLELPETVGTAVQTAAGIRTRAKNTADRVKTIVLGPFAFRGDDEADEAFADIQARMEQVAETLRDPNLTNFRVVFRPEALVLSETERLVSRLGETGIEVSDLVANGVLHDINENCNRCVRQRDRHQQQLNTVRDTFSQPVTEVPELDEPSGIKTLEAVGESLLQD
jgi:arsenite-transporting ATPase